MTDALKRRWFYLLCISFILLNATAFIFDFPWLNALPFVLTFLMLVLFKLDWVLLFLGFLVPLSVNIDNVGLGLGISLPDEPIIMVIMVLSLFKFLIHSEYDYRIFRHPLSIAIFINLGWMFITCCTSELPLVSFKYLLSRFWYVVVFYFLGIMLFRNFKAISIYLWLYMLPLAGVVLYTLSKHSVYGFSQETSYEITRPFFVAHGVYAAVLAFFIPVTICYVLFYRRMGMGIVGILITLLLLVIFISGIFYSYTRAAWLSLMAAAILVIPLVLRIKFRTQLIMLGSALVLFLAFQNQILYMISKNKKASSEGFGNHLQSVSNIKTDASNTERINRWMSAIDMFKDKPVFGFGPGTYSFCYATYQQSRYITEISTNYGDGGDSHSEYLNPLAESGLLGMLTFIFIIFQALSTGFRLIYTGARPKVRILSTAVLLGLFTYVIHGFLNNYSETDKVAAIFWGGFAMLVAMDTYHNPQEPEEEKEEPVQTKPLTSL